MKTLSILALSGVLMTSNLLGQNPSEAATPTVHNTAIDPTIIGELQGTWKNQLGSTLEIKQINGEGQITGVYKSPSGTNGAENPVTGWVNYSNPTTSKDHVVAVSFSVRWKEYGSITSWSGFYKLVDGKPSLVEQWLLVRSNSDFSWDHTLTGLDTFTK